MRSGYLAAVFPALALAACEPAKPASPANPDPAAATAPASEPSPSAAASPSAPLPLAVPINAVMVALVDFAADGVWRPAASDKPLTDTQWLFAEQDATNLIASASLITMPGTGINDATWVAEPEWRRWATDLQVTAAEAKSAVAAKDKDRLKLVGDHLVEICQQCHQEYKPGLPSMGITRFPIYPKRDGT